MDIKIPSGPSNTDLTETVQDSSALTESIQDAGTSDAISATATHGADLVGQIAADLASGRISGDEAVDRLIESILDSSMISSAPEALKLELREVLENFIATDPHLSSLTKDIGTTTK